MFIKPAKGVLLRRPDLGMRPLSIDGEEVPKTAFYRRAVKRGDAIEVKKSATPKKVVASKESSEVK